MEAVFQFDVVPIMGFRLRGTLAAEEAQGEVGAGDEDLVEGGGDGPVGTAS